MQDYKLKEIKLYFFKYMFIKYKIYDFIYKNND